MGIGEKQDLDVIHYPTFPPFLTKKCATRGDGQEVASTNNMHGLTLPRTIFSRKSSLLRHNILFSLLRHIISRRLSTTDPLQGVAVIAAMSLMSLFPIHLIKRAIHIRHILENNKWKGADNRATQLIRVHFTPNGGVGVVVALLSWRWGLEGSESKR